MATNTHIQLLRGGIVVATVAALFAGAATLSSPSRQPHAAAVEEEFELDADELELMGNAGRVPDSKKPKLTAYFLRESYVRGGKARLVVTDRAQDVTLQLFRAGGEDTETVPRDVLLGTPVSKLRSIGDVSVRRALTVRLGNWPSGVYYAQLTAGKRIGYAIFILRPRVLGEHRVAVVLPTQTWQAYNFRDDNGDRRPDTWYFGGNKARLVRPFLNRGVPPHWKQYDAPFVRWLVHTGREVDYLSDQDLRTARSGASLAAAYSLLIFSGHHEYVTEHEYGVVNSFRDRGGNLAFLSANNFFWKITIRNNVMTKIAQWRDLGRPEAALIGVQYRGNDRGEHRAPWLVKRNAAPWAFEGVELRNGVELGSAGIEIDSLTPSSPKGTRVLATVPNLYGPGFTAHMTYYESKSGAKVFAAGAFTLAGAVWEPDTGRLVANVYARLSTD